MEGAAFPDVLDLSKSRKNLLEEENKIFAHRLFLPERLNSEAKIDLIEEEGRFYLFFNLPGIKPASLNVFMNEQMVHVLGNKEGSINQFERKIILPARLDVGSAHCIFMNGVLEIKMDIKEFETPVKIDVQYCLDREE